MSTIVNKIKRSTYLDSLALMRVSVEVQALAGVDEAALMMATPASIDILADAGLVNTDVSGIGANDLIIAVRADGSDSANAAIQEAERCLNAMSASGPVSALGDAADTAVSLGDALERMPSANFALISVPGEFATGEAEAALEAGLDVMVFSDNVPESEERRLKEQARSAGRLLMGPDCGTAIVAGTAMGFANVVPRGNIGVIAASGTGLQELSVLLAAEGMGLSHGLGVGGRDLSEAVGGLGCLAAIERLAADPATQHIVLLSKPSAPKVAERVLDALASCDKPAMACLIGYQRSGAAQSFKGVTIYSRIVDTAEAILGHAIAPVLENMVSTGQRADGGRIHGLFAGGTLCAEAQQVLVQRDEPVESNAPLTAVSPLAETPSAQVHRLLDLGADEFTRGQPHPMLEPSVRTAPLRAALDDGQAAVILVDIVLGHGAHPDPAGVLTEALADNPGKPIVASLCGTSGDPQDLVAQRQKLVTAGVVVHTSAARACEHALALLRGYV